MVIKNILFLIVALATTQVATTDNDNEILLTIYYESLCPDSKSFILNELQPTIQYMNDYVTLKFVPFGKAWSINNGNNGFQCQHGPAECIGNMVQDCALNLMSSRTYTEKVNYVACEMETKASPRGDMQCAQKFNIPIHEIQNCISSGQGTSLQLESEYLTRSVRPTFIPTVTINGVFNQQIQDHSMKDLIGAICHNYRNLKPCAEYYNAKALLSMMG